jgi:hypothetical protein
MVGKYSASRLSYPVNFLRFFIWYFQNGQHFLTLSIRIFAVSSCLKGARKTYEARVLEKDSCSCETDSLLSYPLLKSEKCKHQFHINNRRAALAVNTDVIYT